MKEITKKNWEYTLLQDDDGVYVLSVLCGSIGLYELEIKLNATETSKYLEKGLEYLEGLVKQVRNSPSSFQDRAIKK